MTRMTAPYVRPPRIRPKDALASEEWQAIDPARLERARYLIAVDEFAEVVLRGVHVLTRQELRAV